MFSILTMQSAQDTFEKLIIKSKLEYGYGYGYGSTTV